MTSIREIIGKSSSVLGSSDHLQQSVDHGLGRLDDLGGCLVLLLVFGEQGQLLVEIHSADGFLLIVQIGGQALGGRMLGLGR